MKHESDIHKALYGGAGKSHGGDIHKALYGGKKASGGGVEGAMMPTSNFGANMPKYAEGGDVVMKKRGGMCKRAEGGEVPDFKPPMPKRKGGRACHAEGGNVEEKHRKGGRARMKSKREHHDFGDVVGKIGGALLPFAHLLSAAFKEGGLATGGGAEEVMKGQGSALRKGGRAKRRAGGGDMDEDDE